MFTDNHYILVQHEIDEKNRSKYNINIQVPTYIFIFIGFYSDATLRMIKDGDPIFTLMVAMFTVSIIVSLIVTNCTHQSLFSPLFVRIINK